MTSVACPMCGKPIAIHAASPRGKCKACGEVFDVPAVLPKVCTGCGLDVSHQKRTKDASGNYHCEPCWQAHLAAGAARERAAAAADYGCSVCRRLFPAEQVYEQDGAFVCHGCYGAQSSRIGTAPASDPVPDQRAPAVGASDADQMAALAAAAVSTPRTHNRRPARSGRNRWLVPAIGAVVVATAAGAVWLSRSSRPSQEAAAQARAGAAVQKLQPVLNLLDQTDKDLGQGMSYAAFEARVRLIRQQFDGITASLGGDERDGVEYRGTKVAVESYEASLPLWQLLNQNQAKSDTKKWQMLVQSCKTACETYQSRARYFTQDVLIPEQRKELERKLRTAEGVAAEGAKDRERIEGWFSKASEPEQSAVAQAPNAPASVAPAPNPTPTGSQSGGGKSSSLDSNLIELALRAYARESFEAEIHREKYDLLQRQLESYNNPQRAMQMARESLDELQKQGECERKAHHWIEELGKFDPALRRRVRDQMLAGDLPDPTRRYLLALEQ